MGQFVVVLMYGTPEVPKGLRDEDGYAIWDSPEQPRGKRIDLGDKRCPTFPYEGDGMGFPVACTAPGDDEGDLAETAALADLEKTHGKYLRTAQKRWEGFARWLKKSHGKDLPEPVLYLTRDERA